MSKAPSALSDSFRIALYDTHDRADPPVRKRDGTYLLDKRAVFANECWVYPIVSVFKSEEDTHIPYELQITAAGEILRPMGKAKLDEPIESRPDIFNYDPDHPDKVQFAEKVDKQGRPLMVRLFVSPFRLIRRAIELLCSDDYRVGRVRHIPALWTWSKTTKSALKSADGYYLRDIPTFLRPPSEENESESKPPPPPERVWMAYDPFHVSRRRSDLYVAARKRYTAVYEPTQGEALKEAQKRHLLDVLNQTIRHVDEMPAKYLYALDLDKMRGDTAANASAELEQRNAVARAVERLIKSLDNPFFALLQYASLSAEGVRSDADYSEALAAHIYTLTQVTRRLDETAEGIAVLTRWARDAAGAEHHFINQIVFPSQRLALHAFKTVRWSSKSIVALATKAYPAVLDALRTSVDAIANRTAEGLYNLGVFSSLDEALSFVRPHDLDFTKLSNGLGLADGSNLVSAKVIAAEAAEKIQAFIDNDESGFGKAIKVAGGAAKLAFLLLDVANAYFAWTAFKEAKGEDRIKDASVGTLAAGAFVAASVIEVAFEQITKREVGTRMASALTGLRSIASFAYGVLDLKEAYRAYNKKDTDRYYALVTAASAEFAATGILFYQMMVGAPVFGLPLAAAGAVAAAAYVTASIVQDDYLEIMLQNCAYGTTPYKKKTYSARWTSGPISSWKGDYRKQRRVLLRVLTRFELSWGATTEHPNPLEVRLTCGYRTPETTIKVKYIVTRPDGKPEVDVIPLVGGDDIPLDSATDIAVSPPTNYTTSGARTIVVEAELQHPGEEHTAIATGTIYDKGHWKPSGSAGTLD